MLKSLSLEFLTFSVAFLNAWPNRFGIQTNEDLASSLSTEGYQPKKYTYITVRKLKNGFYEIVDGSKRVSCMIELDGNYHATGKRAFNRIDVLVVG